MSRLSVGIAAFVVLASGIGLLGCPPGPPATVIPPEARFDARPASGNLPLIVQFTDTSATGGSPIKKWTWDFGDGASSAVPNPSHTYYAAGRYAVSLTVTTAGGTDWRKVQNYITVTEPSTVAGIGAGGGSIEAGGAVLDVPAGAFEDMVVIAVAVGEGDVPVQTAETELLVSDVFSIAHDHDDLRIDPRTPLTLEIPYVSVLVPPEDRDGTHVQVLANLDGGVTVPILGEVDNGAIVVTLGGFPERAFYGVVYRPAAVVEGLDVDAELAKLPTSYRWFTNAWRLCYTDARLQELTALRIGSLLNLAAYERRNWSASQVADTLEDVRGDVASGHAALRDAGFISPTMVASPENEYALLFYPINDRPAADFDSLAELTFATSVFGQLVIDPAQLIAISKRNAWADYDQQQELELANAFAQEFFRTILPGYDYPDASQLSPTDLDAHGAPRRVPFYQGFNDGVATYLGQVMANIERPRSLGLNEYSTLGQSLFAPASPLVANYSYATQDFFFYVANRFAPPGDALSFVADSYEGVLELIRVRADEADIAYGDALVESRLAVDIALDRFFDVTLADVYWDFARNRAFENNDKDALLRFSDYGNDSFAFNQDALDAASVFEHTFLTDGESFELSFETEPMLDNVPPFSTRAFVLSAGATSGDLRVAVNAYEWMADAAGNSMRVKVYKEGEDGIALTALDSVVTLDHFGDDGDEATEDFDRAVILISNVAVDREYPVLLTAELISSAPTEDRGSLSGLVGDAATVQPLEGVSVVVRQVAGGVVGAIIASDLSDTSGQFSFPSLPTGDVEVTFSKSGYVTRKDDATIIPNQDTYLVVGLVSL